MEIEKGFISFLAKEEETLQETLDRLTAQLPRLNELDLRSLVINLVEPLYRTYHAGKYLLALVIHGLEAYLPLSLHDSGEGEQLIRSWILLEPFLSGDQTLTPGELDSFLKTWDRALFRLPHVQTKRKWLDIMAAHMNHCRTIEDTYALGRLGAWTLGMAELRLGALEGLKRLPEELVEQIIPSVRHNPVDLRNNPWALSGPFRGGRIGGFSGYGGPFGYPPQCRKLEGSESMGSTGLILHDEESAYHLFADPFGCRLISAPELIELAPTLPEAEETSFLNVRLNRESHYVWIERKNP